MAGKLDIRMVDHRLENLAIGFAESSPEGFGLAHDVANRPFEQFMFDDAVNPRQHAQLPLDTGEAGFLRKPNVQLAPRERESLMITFHRSQPADY